MKITLDTNLLPADDLITACKNLDWDFAVVSVTEREVEDTNFQVSLEQLKKINATAGKILNVYNSVIAI